jgi:hypothetical protein
MAADQAEVWFEVLLLFIFHEHNPRLQVRYLLHGFQVQVRLLDLSYRESQHLLTAITDK